MFPNKIQTASFNLNYRVRKYSNREAILKQLKSDIIEITLRESFIIEKSTCDISNEQNLFHNQVFITTRNHRKKTQEEGVV